MSNRLNKFMKRQRFFLFLINEQVPILTEDDGNLYLYCDPKKVPEKAKQDLATILADMTLNCDVKIMMKGYRRGEEMSICVEKSQ